MPQRLTSQKAIDAWFEQKTKGLNGFQRAVLRKRWATMEELMSAGERKQRIIANIIEDFQCPTADEQKARLALELDLTMRERAPAGWKGDPAREAQVLNALFPLMPKDRTATLAIFEIIKHQGGY